MRNKFLTLLVLMLVYATVSIAAFGQKTGMITGDVSLNLKEDKIAAMLKYDYIAQSDKESEVKFFLLGDFTIGSVKCAKCASVDHSTKERSLTAIKLAFKKPLKKNERVQIEFAYNGALGELYDKKEHFIELGLDFMWIPYESTFQFNFDYLLNIKTDASGYSLVTNGKTLLATESHTGNRDWTIRSINPDFDVNIVLAKDLRISNYREKSYDLKIASRDMPDEVSTQLMAGMVESLDFYNATFGKNRRQTSVTAVFRPFPRELGYFRKGYFILPAPKKADDLFFTISHELAHFWWSKADQQNDWMDESFAEYSAMLAVRKLRGIEKFNGLLERKKKLNVDLPAIYGFDRTKNRQQTPMVLYVKGALKLYDLESELGEEKFLQFLQKVEDDKIVTTDTLVDGLRKFASAGTADKFLANLKN